MSSRTALHIFEAVSQAENLATEVGQLRLQDVITKARPVQLRPTIRSGWRLLQRIDTFAEPFCDLPEVIRAYDRFDVIDQRVRAHLEESESLTDQERKRSQDVWDEDADKVCGWAAKLSLLGLYLRERRGVEKITVFDTQIEDVREFSLSPSVCVKIGLNTLMRSVLSQLESEDGVALSEEAQNAQVAIRRTTRA